MVVVGGYVSIKGCSNVMINISAISVRIYYDAMFLLSSVLFLPG
jgi:hypothetical protein